MHRLFFLIIFSINLTLTSTENTLLSFSEKPTKIVRIPLFGCYRCTKLHNNNYQFSPQSFAVLKTSHIHTHTYIAAIFRTISCCTHFNHNQLYDFPLVTGNLLPTIRNDMGKHKKIKLKGKHQQKDKVFDRVLQCRGKIEN